MTGHGTAFGALSVINAIPCGLGAAFGITLETKAEVTLTGTDFYLEMNGFPAPAEFAELLIHSLCPDAEGAEIQTVSEIPVSKGLKSSSTAANAILLAAADALHLNLSPEKILSCNTISSIHAGVSITGALDDAAASLFGGLVFTDNNRSKIIARKQMPDGLSAVIHLPDYTIAKSAVTSSALTKHSAKAEYLFWKALDGNIFQAMTENGKLIAETLGIDMHPVNRALSCGAKAAGISGTGPAAGILIETEKLDDFLSCFGEDHCIVTNLRRGEA